MELYFLKTINNEYKINRMSESDLYNFFYTIEIFSTGWRMGRVVFHELLPNEKQCHKKLKIFYSLLFEVESNMNCIIFLGQKKFWQKKNA